MERQDTIHRDLCTLALKLLSVPASSAAVERFFFSSNFGMIQSKLRNRRGISKAAKLVYCYRMLQGSEEIEW